MEKIELLNKFRDNVSKIWQNNVKLAQQKILVETSC